MQASLGVEPGEVVAEVAGKCFVRVKLVDIFRHDTRQISEAQRGAVSPELLDGVWRRENHRRGADAQEVGDPATVIVFRMLRQHRPVASHQRRRVRGGDGVVPPVGRVHGRARGVPAGADGRVLVVAALERLFHGVVDQPQVGLVRAPVLCVSLPLWRGRVDVASMAWRSQKK